MERATNVLSVELDSQPLFSNNIVDVKIQNGQIAIIKAMDITHEKLKKQIETLPYLGGRRFFDEQVEKAQLPSMGESFYLYLFENGSLPDQETFIRQYLAAFFERENKGRSFRHNGVSYRYDGLRARILRAYPSLIRDTCFYFMASESKLFDDVSYSLRRDVYDGLDIQVVKNGISYYVSLFVETKKSRRYKKKKYRRHDYGLIKEVCISLNPFDPKYRIGNFSLYQEEHLDYLLQEIERDQFSHTTFKP